MHRYRSHTCGALRATDIGGLLEGGTNLTDVTIVDEEDSFVQIVADGQVVAVKVSPLPTTVYQTAWLTAPVRNA